VQKHFVCKRLKIPNAVDGVDFAERHLGEVLRTSKTGKRLVGKLRWLGDCKKFPKVKSGNLTGCVIWWRCSNVAAMFLQRSLT